jgi:hypothetical protein
MGTYFRATTIAKNWRPPSARSLRERRFSGPKRKIIASFPLAIIVL